MDNANGRPEARYSNARKSVFLTKHHAEQAQERSRIAKFRGDEGLTWATRDGLKHSARAPMQRSQTRLLVFRLVLHMVRRKQVTACHDECDAPCSTLFFFF